VHGGLGRLLVDRATIVSRTERSVLARDLAGTVAYAGIDPMLEGSALQDALLREIATSYRTLQMAADVEERRRDRINRNAPGTLRARAERGRFSTRHIHSHSVKC
jgi:hypothetical protein